MPIEPVLPCVATMLFHPNPTLICPPWYIAVEHTLAAATVNASQKYGETQTVECLKLSPSFPNFISLLLSQPG